MFLLLSNPRKEERSSVKPIAASCEGPVVPTWARSCQIISAISITLLNIAKLRESFCRSRNQISQNEYSVGVHVDVVGQPRSSA